MIFTEIFDDISNLYFMRKNPKFIIFYNHITCDMNYFNLKGEFQNFENY